MSEFQGKTAIVTGAASGVGREVTRLLGERGASVVAVDVAPSVHELASDAVLPLEGDTSVASTAERAVEAATGRYGGLDVLVNNAGLILVKPFVETSEEEWDRVMAVNVKSMFFHCTGFAGVEDPAPIIESIRASHPLGRLASAESVARSSSSPPTRRTSSRARC